MRPLALNQFLGKCMPLLFCVALAIAAPAQTLTNLVSLDGTNGANPNDGSLVQGTDGDFYGTTAYGGAYNKGTVFKITTDGTLTTLYSFCSQANCTDGANPWVGLVQGTDGSFYGTTLNGGSGIGIGSGTVFRVTPVGKLTILHRFCGADKECSDGASPVAGLVEGVDGNFYGTTAAGGGYYDNGTVFKIAPCGTLTTLHYFGNGTNGYLPSGLMLAATGNFYGTTYLGGAGPYGNGGTVFEITPQGKYTTTYRFCSQPNCDDGSGPLGGLIQAPNGSFYGTTYDFKGYGTIFELTNNGTLTNLYTFCTQRNCTDGSQPAAGVVRATDGNFYGTTVLGGTTRCFNNETCGTIFELTPDGTLTTLHNFCSETACGDGAWPYAGLVQGTDGNFYGETYYGGTTNNGTIFKLSTGLKPFVKTLPTFGEVGAKVIVFGNNLTGASSVTFNGTPATFTVESDTAIKAEVPFGAITGIVQVVTPGGTLTSNIRFQVIQ